MRVLIVEDEPQMAELLKRGLTEEGHFAVIARDGIEGLETARSLRFDAIVLDIVLPGLDGLTVARRLRESRNQTPILMLSARDTTSDIVRGLDSGGDDYLTKPFSFEVLLASLRSITRRARIDRLPPFQVGGLRLDPATREVTRDGEAINLTPREFALLELLLRNSGRVVTRQSILESVWGFDSEVSENTIEAFIRLLRMKIDAREPKLIQTVRGVGYCIKEHSVDA
ncbi:MAG: response regulator transcription factor [Acidobacteriaceae bacterium]|nr:response regulator transcription factor [Acidobacteriaceae bacterium]MBV9779473.1 response regulator transcription factor [Acidobacteriaceae bacterium]